MKITPKTTEIKRITFEEIDGQFLFTIETETEEVKKAFPSWRRAAEYFKGLHKEVLLQPEVE
jgi:hypothetical protein